MTVAVADTPALTSSSPDARGFIGRMRTGDVLLTSDRRFSHTSLFIKIGNFFRNWNFAERGWTHVAVHLGGEWVMEAVPEHGVVATRFAEKYLTGDRYHLRLLRHRSASPEKLRDATAACSDESGKKYDMRALAYFALYQILPHQGHCLIENAAADKLFNVADRFFCSELIASGFEKTGICCFQKESYKITPIDFDNPLLFDRIAEIDLTPPRTSFWARIKDAIFSLTYVSFALLVAVPLVLFSLLLILLIVLGGFAVVACVLIGALFVFLMSGTVRKKT